LLNRKVGDEVEFEFHGAIHRHRIEKIEPWKAPVAGESSASLPEAPAPTPAHQTQV
jgi:hypothetical protein